MMKCMQIYESRIFYHWLITHLCHLEVDDIYVTVLFELVHLELLKKHLTYTYSLKTPLYFPSADGQYSDHYWSELAMIKEWAENMLIHFDFGHHELEFDPSWCFKH